MSPLTNNVKFKRRSFVVQDNQCNLIQFKTDCPIEAVCDNIISAPKLPKVIYSDARTSGKVLSGISNNSELTLLLFRYEMPQVMIVAGPDFE